jgi:hypothetical protein
MNARLFARLVARSRRIPAWAWEVLIFAAVTPPLVHAVAALDALRLA